jgi:outer membrane protein TolC
VSLTQPLPWPGRLADRGEAALAGADAQRALVDDEHRHHLVESRAMYAEYWLAGRTLALLTEVRADIVREQRAADAAATAGGPALPAAEAALALATLDRRLLTAHREMAEKAGALNAMLGRAADAALPPPVVELDEPTPLPPVDTLKPWAHRLPVVLAAESRVREAEARIAQARRDGRPELGVSAGWSSMEERDNRFSVGVSTTLPVWRGRRDAAVDEAAADARAARAALAAAVADSERDVLENRARLIEGDQAIALLRSAAIPAAERALAAARAAYAAGNGTLADVLRTRRMLVETRLAEAVERHEYFHRRGYLMDIPPVTGAQP